MKRTKVNHEGFRRKNNSFCPECDTKMFDNLEGRVKCHECGTQLILTIFPTREARKLTDEVVARSYTPHSKSFKPRVRLFPNNPPVVLVKVDPNTVPDHICMNCAGDLQVSFGSMRARMIRGYTKTEVEGKKVDPTTGRGILTQRVFPTYLVGRVCKPCQGKLIETKPYVNNDGKISAFPRENHEVEYLQERTHHRVSPVVTQRMIDMEDNAAEIINEEESKFFIVIEPKPNSKLPRFKIEVPKEFEEDTPNDTKSGINLSAYRKYGSGGRGGRKSYDIEVNFDNKKGAK